MRTTITAVAAVLIAVATAARPPKSGISPPNPENKGCNTGNKPWELNKFTSLVAFGDSYTDDSRLAYFATHNGSAPPIGWINPANYNSASGGRSWPQYVAQYTGVNIYNYAVSGAVCSNEITERWFSGINAPFPSVTEYEIPTYLEQSRYTDRGMKFIVDPPRETVYSIFVGTNDLGNYAFLTDEQASGTGIASYVECVFDAVHSIYDHGGRYFVLQNVPPLQLTPQYGLPSKGGLANTRNWPDKPSNITEVSYKMYEYVTLVNRIFKYETPYLTEVARRFPDAHIAVMDINGLLTDIYQKPSEYLNGTATLNVTGYSRSYLDDVLNPSPDSFMWYDPLHPSEQVARVIAREFVEVVKGRSQWASYWHA